MLLQQKCDFLFFFSIHATVGNWSCCCCCSSLSIHRHFLLFSSKWHHISLFPIRSGSKVDIKIFRRVAASFSFRSFAQYNRKKWTLAHIENTYGFFFSSSFHFLSFILMPVLQSTTTMTSAFAISSIVALNVWRHMIRFQKPYVYQHCTPYRSCWYNVVVPLVSVCVCVCVCVFQWRVGRNSNSSERRKRERDS